jgi:nucleotide-binding universal stress UspA family protein
MAQKILIALDDSKNATRSAKYVAKSFTKDSQVTIFSVLPDTAALCELNSPSLTRLFEEQQAQFCHLEDQKKELIKKAQEEAKDALVHEGFKAENVRLKAGTRKKGVARDIINEAENGYDVVVLGRRGISGIKEFFLGSVSQKVVQGVSNASVLVVS